MNQSQIHIPTKINKLLELACISVKYLIWIILKNTRKLVKGRKGLLQVLAPVFEIRVARILSGRQHHLLWIRKFHTGWFKITFLGGIGTAGKSWFAVFKTSDSPSGLLFLFLTVEQKSVA